MIENFLRKPLTAGEFAADALRAIGLVGIVVAAILFEPTDAGILAAALPVLLIPRFVGVASWLDIVYGVIVLVAAWSNVLDLYTSWTGWDLVVHFACTAVLTMVAYLGLAHVGVVPSRDDAGFRRRVPMVVCPALGLALAALWEMIEWAGHAFITDTIEVGYTDTIGDLAAGGLGAVVAGLLVARLPLTRASDRRS